MSDKFISLEDLPEKMGKLLERAEAAEAEAERLRAALNKAAGALEITADFVAGQGAGGTAEGIRNDAEQARQALSNEPDIKPHMYSPSAMHMGDCKVCGNVADHPWHHEYDKEQARQAMVDAVMNADPAYLPYSIQCARDRLAMAREMGEE